MDWQWWLGAARPVSGFRRPDAVHSAPGLEAGHQAYYRTQRWSGAIRRFMQPAGRAADFRRGYLNLPGVIFQTR